MTQHLQTRAATDADAVQLCTFLNACTLAHQGIARFSPDDAVARLHQADADPRLDSFVVSDADAIVGFGHVWRDGDDEIKFFARTHPDARGRGVGQPPRRAVRRALRGAAPRRPLDDHDLGGRHRRADACCASTATGTSATTSGWRSRAVRSGTTGRRGRRRWRACPSPSVLDLGSALYDAWVGRVRGRMGEPARRPRRRSGASAATTRTSRPTRSTRRIWLLACDGDEVIGFCLCELSTPEAGAVGRVAEIGVVPARRGTGLGAALLHRGFHELRRRGAERIVLDVDAENVTSAIRLYTSAGMTPQPAFTVWEKTHAATVR